MEQNESPPTGPKHHPLALSSSSTPGLAGLRYVEVETSRYCNRSCDWCPNGHTNARRTQQLMEWAVFTKITAELGAAGFDGFFAFHNFSEPLANPRLNQEITQVRRDIPHAKPAIYTNGDLFTRSILEQMSRDGVKYIRVTRYPHRPDVQPTYEVLQRWLTRAKLSDLYPWDFVKVRQGLAATWTDDETGMKVEIIRPSIVSYNDRGGTAVVPLPGKVRIAPCRMTATSISIDYRAEMKMCCNVIPDSAPEHERYVVGNLAASTLSELWNSSLMGGWRERHGRADWSMSPACRTCVQALPETRR